VPFRLASQPMVVAARPGSPFGFVVLLPWILRFSTQAAEEKHCHRVRRRLHHCRRNSSRTMVLSSFPELSTRPACKNLHAINRYGFRSVTCNESMPLRQPPIAIFRDMHTRYLVAFAPRHAVRAPNSSPIEMKSKQVEISREMARGCLEHGPRGGNSGHRAATGPRHQPQQIPANLH
jgi:hypothetical protein